MKYYFFMLYKSPFHKITALYTKLFSKYNLLFILYYQLISSLQPNLTFTVQNTAQICINDISWSYV